jgi:hypothetical protein
MIEWPILVGGVMRRRRRVQLLASCALVTAVVIGGTASSVHSATPPKPVVVVTPNTGLADLQLVTMTGTGFSANASIATLQCRPGATQPSDCDLGTLTYVSADASGSFTMKRAVHRLMGIGGANVDCVKPGSCVLAAANLSNYAESNGVVLGFDPNKPFVVPKVTASPNKGLADHQLVTVKGSGFAPLSAVSITQCLAPAATPTPPPGPGGPFPYPCDTSVYRYLVLGAGQDFTSANFPVQRFISTYGPTGPRLVDCAIAPGCVITARGNGSGSSASFDAVISFDPKKPAAVQDISVTPASGLADHQMVTVRGSGFLPGGQVVVTECAGQVCDYAHTRQVTAGLTGAFTLSFSVQRSVTFGYGPSGPTPTDCAAHAGACALRANSYGSFGPGNGNGPTRPLTFDASRPLVKASIDVNPDDNLRDNQIVSVHGKGFVPLQPVQLFECSAAIESAPSGGLGGFGLCDYSTFAQGSVDRHGDLSADFTVHDVVSSSSALLSCAPRNCVLVAQGGGLFFGGGFAYGPGIVTPAVGSSVTTIVGPGASVSSGRLSSVAVGPGPSADEHVNFPYVTLKFAPRDR